MKIMTSYSEIPSKTWCELLAENWGGHIPPMTVHLPIHPAYSPDFIHVDAALNVCRRRVAPHLDAEDETTYRAVRRSETLLMQFALGAPAIVPDFRHAHISLDEG